MRIKVKLHSVKIDKAEAPLSNAELQQGLLWAKNVKKVADRLVQVSYNRKITDKEADSEGGDTKFAATIKKKVGYLMDAEHELYKATF